MSNHYYANGAVINDQHKELNIHGNLTTQQVMMIAKDFFAEETVVTEENDEVEVDENSDEVDEDAEKNTEYSGTVKESCGRNYFSRDR